MANDWRETVQAVLDLQADEDMKTAPGPSLQWYPQQWLYWPWPRVPGRVDPALAQHLRFLHRTAHKLARTIFHCTLRYQAGLEKRQLILSRVVNIGIDLFVMGVSCSRAQQLVEGSPSAELRGHGSAGGAGAPSDQSPVELADMFCQYAQRRIQAKLKAIWSNDDGMINRVAGTVLDGNAAWLETGVMPLEEAPVSHGALPEPEKVVAKAR